MRLDKTLRSILGGLMDGPTPINWPSDPKTDQQVARLKELRVLWREILLQINDRRREITMLEDQINGLDFQLANTVTETLKILDELAFGEVPPGDDDPPTVREDEPTPLEEN